VKAYRKLDDAGFESVADDAKAVITPIILWIFEVCVIGGIERLAAELRSLEE
jgi:hypothetical protein